MYYYTNYKRKEVLPMSLFASHRTKAGILICSLFIFSLFQPVCFGYEFQIVHHFKNPLKGPVGYLTSHSDGHLYATKKAGLGYENRIYKIDPSNGEFAGFIENTDEMLSQLKYITSCNGTLYAVSYTHLTLPTTLPRCRSRWSPYH